jgi:dienelactone hydrolase
LESLAPHLPPEQKVKAYYARPTRAGRYPGMVVIHHLPGWDEWIIEVTRKFAHHGYVAVAPHRYFRDGPGDPDDVGARVRATGGVADDQVRLLPIVRRSSPLQPNSPAPNRRHYRAAYRSDRPADYRRRDQ